MVSDDKVLESPGLVHHKKALRRLDAGKDADLSKEGIEVLVLILPSAGCATLEQKPALSGPHFFSCDM